MRQCTVIIGRTHHGDGRTTQHEASEDFKTFVGSMSFDRQLHFCRERGKYFYLFYFYFYFLWIWVITNKKGNFLRVLLIKFTLFGKFVKMLNFRIFKRIVFRLFFRKSHFLRLHIFFTITEK